MRIAYVICTDGLIKDGTLSLRSSKELTLDIEPDYVICTDGLIKDGTLSLRSSKELTLDIEPDQFCFFFVNFFIGSDKKYFHSLSDDFTKTK